MKFTILFILNLGLIGFFIYLMRRPNLLSFPDKGRVWLTWFAVAIITLMDEFTSVFYAPAESYRFIGLSAIVFIALTSLLIRFLCTRLVEIAEVLEQHHLIGGGVYSFSYLVLGPLISFVAVASIMVDYILTACISAVSAVQNAASFFAISPLALIVTVLIILWAVAGLNILGIRENARFVFSIFILAAFVMLNLIASGILAMDSGSWSRLQTSAHEAAASLHTGSWLSGYDKFISNIAFCILAYSGVESVLQTAGLVKNWREISKAYWFLAGTVGLVTPLMAALALSAPIEFAKHEGDLITYYATMLNGVPFGIAVAALASLTLIMAVNTAFVASSELMERVAHRYGFEWLIVTNNRQSLYRIHILSAAFFSLVIFITSGSQQILADMYALGLVASFCINVGGLIIYRYFKGRTDRHYYTNRLGTIILWVILVSCFIFLALDKPHGTMLWASVTALVLIGGIIVAKRRGPELRELGLADTHMDLVLYLAESEAKDLHIIFRRPQERSLAEVTNNEAYVSFYTLRLGSPPKLAPHHFRFASSRAGLFHDMVSLLRVVEYELAGWEINVHIGWPMSSWLDRLAIGVMVFNLIRLPRLFPHFNFEIRYHRHSEGIINGEMNSTKDQTTAV